MRVSSFLPRRLRRLPLSACVALFALVLLLLAWVAVGAVLHARWRDAIDAQTQQNTNLARVLAEQTLRVLATTDQAVMRMRDAAAAGSLAAPDMVRYASETGLAPQILVQLSLIDASGRFVGSNLDPDGRKTGPVDLSQREHVRAHLAPRTLDGGAPAPGEGLFIGRPVLGKVSQRWTIQLSRRIAGPDGHALGVVVASLDPGYFEDVYRRVALGERGGVALIGADLGVRARVIGGRSAGMGATAAAGSAFARRADGAEGHYIGASSLDGVERITAYRRVADHPLYVLVSTSKDDALAAWRATRSVTLALAALLSAAVITAVATFVIGLRRLERSNAALRRSEAQAQSASQAKSEFLAAMSHELRTPLTSIRGFAELMERRIAEPVFREQAGLIRKGAQRLDALLGEILDLTQLEAGAMTLGAQAHDVRALVEASAELFALPAQGKGLALHVRVADDVPRTLQCDALRVKQVLNKLLSNAVKFTDSGSVTLAVERAGEELRFHVEDTGLGIEPPLQELIFERFRQGDARVAYEHGGVGLGLALARALAQLMRGRLTLRSTPGHGARFTLALPLAASAA